MGRRGGGVGRVSNALLVLIGVGLVLVGVLISGSGRDSSARIGNTGFSVFGSVKQSFHSVGLAISGERQKSARDLIGWSISGAGLLVSLFFGLFRP